MGDLKFELTRLVLKHGHCQATGLLLDKPQSVIHASLLQLIRNPWNTLTQVYHPRLIQW
jgi:hypothetical protein